MMFLGHIAFSTTIVTSVLGLALLAWSKKESAAASVLRKGAYVVLLLSLSNMFCISYYMVKYWNAGYFSTPMSMSGSHGMGMMKMDGMNMMDCPMMKDMMKGDMGKSAPEGVSPEDHEAHH